MDRPGIRMLTERLTLGIDNWQFADWLANKAETALPEPSLRRRSYYEAEPSILSKYQQHRDGFFANTVLKVFEPFAYEGRPIDPKETIDGLIDQAETLYGLVLTRIDTIAGDLVDNQPTPVPQWFVAFERELTKTIGLAEDVAHWAAYLSTRPDTVGKRTRTAMDRMGIVDPFLLPKDVRTIGSNALGYLSNLQHDNSKL
jgi:hypothetical protein